MVVQALLELQPKWTVHLWSCGKIFRWSGMVHLQRNLPLPQVHRDDDTLHLTQYTKLASVVVTDVRVCVAHSTLIIHAAIATVIEGLGQCVTNTFNCNLMCS